MGILQKKCRATGKKALEYSGRGRQNTDTAFLALRLGVVLDLTLSVPAQRRKFHLIKSTQNKKVHLNEFF